MPRRGQTKRRRADGPDDGSLSVVKSVWYCKHIDIAFVTTSPVSFCSSFLGWMNGKRGGYAMERQGGGGDTDPSSTCHPDDGTAGRGHLFVYYAQIYVIQSGQHFL